MEEKEQGSEGDSSPNDAEKKRRRKKSVPGDPLKNVAVARRVLRSHAAKLREQEAEEEAKTKCDVSKGSPDDETKIIKENGVDEKRVSEGFCVGIDQNVRSCVISEDNDGKCEAEIIVESKYKLDVGEVEKFGEEIEAECKTVERRESSGDSVKEEAIEESGSGAGQINGRRRGRKRKIKREGIVLENRRITRSCATKQREEASSVVNHILDEDIKVQNVLVSKSSKQSEENVIIIEEAKVRKKRNTMSNVSNTTSERLIDKGSKKLMELDIKRNQSSDVNTPKKETNAKPLICMEDAVPSKGENFPSRKRAKRDLKKFGDGHRDNVQVKSRGRSSRLLQSDQEGESEISHIYRNDGENKGSTPVTSSLRKNSKNTDASSSKTVVTVNRESETLGTKPNKTTEKVERSMARKKLRDEIKSMLFSAGWKIELRPRNGRNYLDAVYVSPEGIGHWSIVKAYYVLQRQSNGEHEDDGKHLSREPHWKSRRASVSTFSPIPEDVLSILKHPISQRRSKKQIEETNLKFGIDSRSKKFKKNIRLKHQKQLCKNNGGRAKGRGRKGDILASSKKRHRRKYRRKQKGCALVVRGLGKGALNRTDSYVPYVGKRTILSWIIDLGIVAEKARVKYMNSIHTEVLLDGQITRDGIYCGCCNEILPVLKFEAHAGSKLCHPYQNIFVEEAGISLLQCQVNAWKKQEPELGGFYMVDTHGEDSNDDTCAICGDGGDLICCDGCPSTFHQCCLGTEMLPPGDWYCMNCTCRYCGAHAGAVTEENGDVVSPLQSCSQCEEKYHKICVPGRDAAHVGSSEAYDSFCGEDCKQLSEKLHMLVGGRSYLDAGFSSTLIRRFDEDLPNFFFGLDQRAECNSKIALAFSVMDECFLPIIDQRSGINLIHNVVYNCGSNFNRLNYHGFYTFILERDDEIISVASVRLRGTKLAEMPFIGTRNMYRRQGMCRRLLNEIESVLRSLKIERLVIPAISELVDTWTNVFGFKHLETSQQQDLKSINLMIFPGIGMLLKSLQEEDSVEPCVASDRVDKHETESDHHHTPDAAYAPIEYDPTVEYGHRDSGDVDLQHNLEAKTYTLPSSPPQTGYEFSEIATDQGLPLQTVP